MQGSSVSGVLVAQLFISIVLLIGVIISLPTLIHISRPAAGSKSS